MGQIDTPKKEPTKPRPSEAPKGQGKYGDSPLEVIAPDIHILKIMEEIVYQNGMILEAFSKPQVILKRAEG